MDLWILSGLILISIITCVCTLIVIGFFETPKGSVWDDFNKEE
jgi:hypothetical protein